MARAAIFEAMAWASPPTRAAARGARAIGNWDEDALTMAVEAARSCLERAAGDASDAQVPGSVLFCSTTAPFADRDDAVVLCAALDLAEHVETLNLSSSLRAGTSGLISAIRRADVPALVVASDARLTRAGSPQELS